MLNISFEDTDLTISVVSECVNLHSDLLDIYDDISEDVHYSYMCESNNAISTGIDKIKTGFINLFERLKTFFKTIIDKFISLFTKKSRATNVKKERLRSILDDKTRIEPFKISTYNYFFSNNLETLLNVAYNESNKITRRINEILKGGESSEFYNAINTLKADMGSEEGFNKMRRAIIQTFTPDGAGAPMPKNQYIPELQLALRGGNITKSEIEITRSVLEKIIKDDDEQGKIRKELESYKNNITNMFTILEGDFTTAVKVISDKTWKVDAKVNSPMREMGDIRVFDEYQFDYSKKILESLNGLFNASVVYFKNLSDVVSIALTEYSKAIVESMDTNAEIFSIALGRIERVN